MKKLCLLLFLFSAGIVFSQTDPLQAEDETGVSLDGADEITDLETFSELDDEETADTGELTQTGEEAEEDLETALSSEDEPQSSVVVKRQPFWITEQDQTLSFKFPQWTNDLRRGEIVALGAFPIMVFFSRMFLDLYRTATHNWDNNYAPWPFTGPNSVGLTDNEVKLLFGIAGFTSVLVSVADHFIIKHKRKKAASAKVPIRPANPAKPESPEDIEDFEDIEIDNEINEMLDEMLEDTDDEINDGA
jgi:hypothetical protein